MDQKDAPEYKVAQQALALMPELTARTPVHRIAVGGHVLGLKAFERLSALDGGPGAGYDRGQSE